MPHKKTGRERKASRKVFVIRRANTYNWVKQEKHRGVYAPWTTIGQKAITSVNFK